MCQCPRLRHIVSRPANDFFYQATMPALDWPCPYDHLEAAAIDDCCQSRKLRSRRIIERQRHRSDWASGSQSLASSLGLPAGAGATLARHGSLAIKINPNPRSEEATPAISPGLPAVSKASQECAQTCDQGQLRTGQASPSTHRRGFSSSPSTAGSNPPRWLADAFRTTEAPSSSEIF